MYNKSQIIVINIVVIVLIVIYFFYNICFDFKFRHNYYICSTLEANNNFTNQLIYSSTKFSEAVTKQTTVSPNVSNFVSKFRQFNDIQMRVKRTDERLKRLSKFTRIRSDSRLIFPKQMFQMTEMTISDKHCSQQFGEDLLLLVLVFNRVDGFERRQTIRETWGQDIKTNPKSKLYFAVGLTRDTTVQKKSDRRE